MVRTGPGNRLQQVTEQLHRTWLTWGLLPVAACLVLTLVADTLAGGQAPLSERQIELRFQVIFALSAGLFLIAFSLDNHWTSAQKLGARLLKAAFPEGSEARKVGRQKLAQLLAAQSPLAFETILSSTLALTIVGGGMGLLAVLAAAARLGVGYAALLLLLAAEYQVFVFSRHAYYKEVLVAAEAGELLSPAADNDASA